MSLPSQSVHLVRLLGPTSRDSQRLLARTEKRLYELLIRIYRSPEAMLSVTSAAPLRADVERCWGTVEGHAAAAAAVDVVA